MLGVMSLWTGLMEIANRSGLIDKCTKAILPLMQWLFPGVPKDHDAMQHITTNVIANFLGLGLGGDTGGTACNESAFRVKRGKQPRQHRYVYLSCN